MTEYRIGETFKDVPVIKFVRGDVIILLNGEEVYALATGPARSKVEYIDLSTIGEIPAPQGMKADVVATDLDTGLKVMYLKITKLYQGSIIHYDSARDDDDYWDDWEKRRDD